MTEPRLSNPCPKASWTRAVLCVTACLLLHGPVHGAAMWLEDFSQPPLSRDWSVFGATNLFAWDETGEQMNVTWDSSRPNSYFYRSLGNILTQDDDFRLAFQLQLDSIAIGVDPEKPYTFELAIGFLNLKDATGTNFFRGAGINAAYGPRNLVELDYFPDSGFGATVAPTVVSTNNRLTFSDNHPLELTLEDTFDIALSYTASNRVLKTVMWRNGAPFGLGEDNRLADLSVSGFPDFRVDTVAICSYSDDHQPTPQFAGSLLAQGVVDNIEVTMPPPPVRELRGAFEDGEWQVHFLGRTNWVYYLERSEDASTWMTVDTAAGAASMRLVDLEAQNRGYGIYRIRSERP